MSIQSITSFKVPYVSLEEKNNLLFLCYQQKEQIKNLYHVAVARNESVDFILKNKKIKEARIQITPLNKWFIYPLQSGSHFAFTPDNHDLIFREPTKKIEWVAKTIIPQEEQSKIQAVFQAHKQQNFPNEKSRREGMRVIPKLSTANGLNYTKSIYISEKEELFIIDQVIFNSKISRRRKIQKLISVKTGQIYVLRRSGIKEQTVGEAQKNEKFSKMFHGLPGCIEINTIDNYTTEYGNGIKIKNQKTISKYYCGGDLLSFNEHASLSDKIYVCLGAAIGLRSIHSLGVVHSDIKPENIFVEKYNDQGKTRYRSVIADFGSCAFEKDEEHSLGTNSFLSPKIILGKINSEQPPVNKKDDIWALGLTFLEIMRTGISIIQKTQLLYKKADYIMTLYQKKEIINQLYIDYLQLLDQIHEELETSLNPIIKDLIPPMLAIEEINRPTIEEIVCSLTEELNRQLGRTPNLIKEEHFPKKPTTCCSVQ